MNAPAESSLLTTSEIAELLQIHPKQVYRLVRQGLPGRRLGGEWRFLREQVLAWVAGAAPPAEGVAESAVASPPAAVQPESSSPPLVAANGDIAVEKLLALVNRGRPVLGFLQTDRDQALALLEGGAVIAAGCHGKGPPPRLGDTRLARLHLVRREVGLAAAPGRKVPSLAKLVGRRLALRPATAGILIHLDAALRERGLDPVRLLAGARAFDSHRDVVCALLRGDADVGLTTRAWAHQTGLAFTSIATESYGLLIRAADLGDARIVRLCEAAQGQPFRAALADFPGYDARGAGDIRYDRDE